LQPKVAGKSGKNVIQGSQKGGRHPGWAGFMGVGGLYI